MILQKKPIQINVTPINLQTASEFCVVRQQAFNLPCLINLSKSSIRTPQNTYYELQLTTITPSTVFAKSQRLNQIENSSIYFLSGSVINPQHNLSLAVYIYNNHSAFSQMNGFINRLEPKTINFTLTDTAAWFEVGLFVGGAINLTAPSLIDISVITSITTLSNASNVQTTLSPVMNHATASWNKKGCIIGGRNSSLSTVSNISLINIQTQNINIQQFSELSLPQYYITTSTWNERACCFRNIGTDISTVEFITIAFAHNSRQFGSIETEQFPNTTMNLSWNNRGLRLCRSNNMQFTQNINIQTAETAIHGSMLPLNQQFISSNTWNNISCFVGGITTNANISLIEYVMLHITMNTSTFGYLNDERGYCGTVTYNNYGLQAGGITANNDLKFSITYITVNATSNSRNFGSLSRPIYSHMGLM